MTIKQLMKLLSYKDKKCQAQKSGYVKKNLNHSKKVSLCLYCTCSVCVLVYVQHNANKLQVITCLLFFLGTRYEVSCMMALVHTLEHPIC